MSLPPQSALALRRRVGALAAAAGVALRAWLPTPVVAAPAAMEAGGRLTGIAVLPGKPQPAGRAVIEVESTADRRVRRRAIADAAGHFEFTGLPWGDYRLYAGGTGPDHLVAGTIVLDAAHSPQDLGRVVLPARAVALARVQVIASRETFSNSIDRKIYEVSRDLQSLTGSASELLQNIPSVDVDFDGNVSLRGSGNVQILINGQSSPLLNAANRSMALEQMPADEIERIEVITNPSAKYQPDGTAGIINLVLKRPRGAGFSGSARASGGNDGRANAGVSVNYDTGRTSWFGALSVRQDDRPRFSQDTRQHLDPSTQTFLTTTQTAEEHSRPQSWLFQAGWDFRPNPSDKFGVAADYNHLTFYRTAVLRNQAQDAGGNLTGDYDRLRTDPEWHKTASVTATYEHRFATEGHQLDLSARNDRHQELEDNLYADVYRVPAAATTHDDTRMQPTETTREVTLDYSRPLAHDAKLEAGGSWQGDKADTDFRASFQDPASGRWVEDATRTDRFIYRDSIRAGYVTFSRPWGRLGVEGGLRLEQTTVRTNQVTLNQADRNDYARVYPSLHLAYRLSDVGQLQLNYSHRIRRPESDDLDPFPEYQDPYNLRAGNPQLRPEETHSVEAGYQHKDNQSTWLATVFYRYTDHAFTTVSRYVNATTLLTTQENLAVNRSGGLELAANTDPTRPVSLNLSSDVYWAEVDASNLGYSARRSTLTWSAKANVDWHLARHDLLQLDSRFQARQLTAQGYRQPTFVINLGWRHEFRDQKTALVVTVSDVFNTLRERTVIDTPILHDDYVRRRTTRIVYAGLVYHFGRPAKKKDNGLQFDNQL